MAICNGQGIFSFADPCVRDAWTTLLPAAYIIFICITSIPLPTALKTLTNLFTSSFRPFLTLPEAEAYDRDLPALDDLSSKSPSSVWRMFSMSWIAIAETVVWMGLGCYRLTSGAQTEDLWDLWGPIIIALSWLYAAVRPILRPTATPPYDLFVFYILQIFGAAVKFGSIFFTHDVYGDPLPSVATMVAVCLNISAVLALLLIVVSMPMALPSEYVDPAEIGRSVSPEDYTSLWGWMSFHWVVPLISRGTYNTLNESDVWSLSPTFQARPVFRKFSDMKRKSLLWQLWAANSLDLTLDFVLTFLSVIFNYSSPFFLKRILDSLDPPTREKRAEAYILACLMFIATVLKAEADVQHLWFGRRASTRMRSELMTAIYDKTLKRKDFSGIVKAKEKKEVPGEKKKKDDKPKSGADVGKIENLMAGDANRVAMMTGGLYMLYSAPFEILIASFFLYRLLGLSAFVGFSSMIIVWPLNSFLANRSITLLKGVLAAKDKRLGVLNELIGAVKFIKFFTWEERWIARAMEAREKELDWIIKSRINNVMFQLLWSSASISVSVITFLVYVMQGNQLTVGVAFTAIQLFSMLRLPLNVIPAWIVQLLETRVSLQRIETYLDEDEVTEQISSLKGDIKNPPVPNKVFGFKNASFRWNSIDEVKDEKKPEHNKITPEPSEVSDIETASVNSEGGNKFELKDLSIIFPEGELTLVTGPTASGKSALLMALLGEMTILPGGEILMAKIPSVVDQYGLTHAISYAAQMPWLQHATIKENILFGYPYDEQRYKDVIECCALLPDLKILEDGDATEIGARGVSLSGGQKARVALARAVYAPSKYVLLDDPLSAVDSHTARFLCDRLFQGPLMKHRTVILVSHHVELVLPCAGYLARMLDGRIDVHGTIKELRTRGILDEISQDAALETKEEKEEDAAAAPPTSEEPMVVVAPEDVIKPKKARKLIEEEERASGSVKWSIYNTYLKASSYWTWGVLFTLIILSQLLGVTERWWIKIWGESYKEADLSGSYLFSSFASGDHTMMHQTAIPYRHALNMQTPMLQVEGIVEHLPPVQERPLFYVAVYSAIGVASIFINVTAAATQYIGALRASRILFRKLLNQVVRATMRWHDVTPTGRMMNRFQKDIETIDSTLASSLQAVNSSLANFFSSVIVVVVVFPFFIIPASLIGYLYYILALGYLNTGRDLRRMESTSRSPIFSGFSELLEGIVTVRAFSAEKRFLNSLYTKIDLTTQMWYSFWMTNRFLLLHFDVIGGLAVLLTTIFALSSPWVSAGLAGFCITSAMTFTNNVYWACRFWTQLELDLNSVERVVEYLELPQEPPAIIENHRPPAYWPSSADNEALIRVEDLEVKYAPDLPSVLHGISFTLRARERVGLLGRTGSGKSTLAMSVLRFVDPCNGRIIIDGIDITTIGIQDLRSRLTFIPQDATLFSGTLRDNLDPFGDYTDDDCIDALYRVQMMTENAYLSAKSSREPSRAPSIHGVEREETGASSATSGSPTATEIDPQVTITLDMPVSAGGTNFSQGQRQLVSMARALLRQSSVIVLDEATSSIDFETDAKIQATIRDEFHNSLLLTVAHRLRTVIDYDRLIVLDKGKIAEFDTPWNLIQKEGGIFRGMCQKSGTFAELEHVAKAKAEKDSASAHAHS